VQVKCDPDVPEPPSGESAVTEVNPVPPVMPREEVATHDGILPVESMTVLVAPIVRRVFMEGLAEPTRMSPRAA
jgi:hypothetical protein